MVNERIRELEREADEFEATGSYALARLKRGDAEFYRRKGDEILARLHVWKTSSQRVEDVTRNDV